MYCFKNLCLYSSCCLINNLSASVIFMPQWYVVAFEILLSSRFWYTIIWSLINVTTLYILIYVYIKSSSRIVRQHQRIGIWQYYYLLYWGWVYHTNLLNSSFAHSFFSILKSYFASLAKNKTFKSLSKNLNIFYHYDITSKYLLIFHCWTLIIVKKIDCLFLMKSHLSIFFSFIKFEFETLVKTLTAFNVN